MDVRSPTGILIKKKSKNFPSREVNEAIRKQNKVDFNNWKKRVCYNRESQQQAESMVAGITESSHFELQAGNWEQ